MITSTIIQINWRPRQMSKRFGKVKTAIRWQYNVASKITVVIATVANSFGRFCCCFSICDFPEGESS